MRPITPRGFRDVLPLEAAEREFVVQAAQGVFCAWGYEPVETPVVEVYDTLEAGAGGLEGTAFRLFDVDGRLLALRPDMTVPIARLVAARMPEAGTKRFRYCAEVFREHESLRGQARQFTQLGVELIGGQGPAADAELIAVLVEALQASGLVDFTVVVGDVAVLAAVVAAADAGDSWGDAVLAAAHDRNLVAIDRLSTAEGVDERVGEALRKVVRIRGRSDAIAACRETLESLDRAAVLDELEQTWRLIGAAGVGERVSVDFGVMRSFDYYTGMVFEVYAPRIGVPLGGGGRYDTVLERYGAASPAAGFALGLERLTIALAEDRRVPLAEPDKVMVGGEPVAAFAEAARRRGEGQRVLLAAGLSGDGLAAAALVADARAVEAR